MAFTESNVGITIGDRRNKQQAVVGIPAGSSSNEPGILVLEGTSGSAFNSLYLWVDQNGKLRYNSSKPSDEDADGYALDNTTIGAAANKQLDNLASVAIPCDLVSDTTSTDNLGSSSIYWQYSYIDRMYVNSTAYIDGGTAGEIALVGNVDIGVSGTGKDVNFFGANYNVVWDASEDTLEIKDNTVLAFGAGDDITIKHDGTDTHIDGGASSEVLKIGDGTTIDLYICGANDDVVFDASADKLMLQDTLLLGFGTGASTNSDITFAYDGSNDHLDIKQVAGGTGDIQIGVDGKGIDVKFFAETASDYMQWNQDGSSSVGALTFVDSAIIFDQSNVDYTLQATTDALALTATDNSSAALTLGSTGTNGMDVTFQTKTSDDTIKFDAGAKTFTLTDVHLALGDADEIRFGASGDITMEYDGSGDTLDVKQGTDGTGGIDFIDMNVAFTGADSLGTIISVTGLDTTGNSDSVVIDHKGTGHAVYIDLNEADSGGIEIEAYTSHTASGIVLDGTTAGWKGADDTGFLHIKNDVALAHAGASLLYITESGTPITSAEGFLARFEHTGTARTNSSAVEIEVPATQPALATNGIVAITGQDNPGASLVQVTGIDTSGDTDTMSIDHSGAGNALYIDQNEADSQAITTEPYQNSTVASIEVDGDTAGWYGANGVGMVHLKDDIALGHANASMLLIDKSAAIAEIDDARGTCLRIVEDMDASSSTPSYAAYISSTNNEALYVDSGYVKLDEFMDAAGVVFTKTSRTATDAGDGTGQIVRGESFIEVDADSDANHIITLPAPSAGEVIWLAESGSTGYELRTNQPQTVAINGGTGAAAETAIAATDVLVRAVASSSTTWIATCFAADGTETAADAAA